MPCPIRATYTLQELLETIQQNLSQCDDPTWVAKMATKICGPTITWNKKTEEFEELE